MVAEAAQTPFSEGRLRKARSLEQAKNRGEHIDRRRCVRLDSIPGVGRREGASRTAALAHSDNAYTDEPTYGVGTQCGVASPPILTFPAAGGKDYHLFSTGAEEGEDGGLLLACFDALGGRGSIPPLGS